MEEAGRVAIGALSKHTGTSIESIRYYERVGLLPAPARSSGGYRMYGRHHIKRLTFVRRARTLGFSIVKVRTLLQLADERRRSCADVRVVAEAHLKDVRAKIADLKRMERALQVTVAGCVSGRRAHCPVIETLDRTSWPHVASRAVSARRARAGGSASATPA